jgi:homoserine kinase
VSLKANSHTVVVPGSVANLGGGFDTLGVAVELYLRARILDVDERGPATLTVVKSVPAVKGQNALERGFAAVARRTGRRAPAVTVEVESDIPMAAGLGSSAAATVAGIRIFEQLTGPLDDDELLGAATEVEGHADNAAPALFGGLTSVLERRGQNPIAMRWSWPEDLRLVVATPAIGLATAKARAALADAVPRQDAIFNLQRVLALVHALQARDFGALREAVQDRWHQPARAALVPLLGEVLALDDADVFGSFLSGAGPSVALLASRNLDRVSQVLKSIYERAGVAATVRVLGVHLRQGSGGQGPSSTEALVVTGASGLGRTV